MPFAPMHAVGEDERRRAHAGNADPFAAQVGDRVDVALHRRLHAQAALVNAGGEFHVEPLLDRLEEIHHEMVRDVVAAEREHVLVFAPLAFHELDLETFLLEKSLLDRGENRRLAGDADVADAHLGQTVRRFLRTASPSSCSPRAAAAASGTLSRNSLRERSEFMGGTRK